jgi:polysaccharide deacetylase 2 family uncharacterized protein YibQ
MAVKQNRRRKANRRSPKRPDTAFWRFAAAVETRWILLVDWASAHRGRAIAMGLAALFLFGLLGGHWLAQRLDSHASEQVVRDTLEEMKHESDSAPPPRYARIEDLPGLPRYTEAEPGAPSATIEEKPRAVSPQVAAAAAQPEQAWRRYAVPFRDLNSRPLIAIVIDDVGLDRPHSKRAWELPGPLTMSFLPYAKDLREQARNARAHGQELMLHLPMEPVGRADPGPNALLVMLGDADLRARVTAALDSFDGYVGVNNHMGSRFTAFKPGMETMLRLLRQRGLLFLDSRTSAQSLGNSLAQEMGVASLTRNVFLDDDMSIDQVRRKLAETEGVARRQGFVVAIGHPHEATLQALSEWLPGVAAKGMALAPITAVLRKRHGWD